MSFPEKLDPTTAALAAGTVDKFTRCAATNAAHKVAVQRYRETSDRLESLRMELTIAEHHHEMASRNVVETGRAHVAASREYLGVDASIHISIPVEHT